MTSKPSVFSPGAAHRALLPIGLLSLAGLLSACGGGGNASPELERSAAASAASQTSTPSPADTASLLAKGAALNAQELAEAQAAADSEPALARKTGQIALDAVIETRLPVYRFFNRLTGSHFYTASTTERDAVQTGQTTMNYEGQAFVAASRAATGLKPVYRFYNTTTGAHFYTISETERELIEEQLPQFNYEGIAYYASQTSGLGMIPLHRFYINRSGTHFYTADASERQQVQETLSATHGYEGVGYYVLSGECTVVNDAYRQAVANGCYLANNDSEPVEIRLAPSSELTAGDTLRVAGPGSGGWGITLNEGQVVQAALPGAVVGVIWKARDTNREWSSVASSTDGRKLVAVATYGRIYTSTDMGATWTPRDESRNWTAVTSSADGQKLAATANNTQIYLSSDAGLTWTPAGPSLPWTSIASSADGTKLAAVASGGSVYTSTDSGAHWAQTTAGEWLWTSVASSADGEKLVAVAADGQIHTSSDAGAHWTPRDSSRNWTSVASSADGNKLVAVVRGGNIYTSADAGATWSTYPWLTRDWTSVASSADGEKLVVVAADGSTMISDDGGLAWRYGSAASGWSAVTSSADGNRLVALELDGQIHTSRAGTTYASESRVQGEAASSIDLKYLGNDEFEMLASTGSVSIYIFDGCGNVQNAPKSGARRKC